MLAIAALASAVSLAAAANFGNLPSEINLFFTEVAEGRNSNRYMEVYNGGTAIADLSKFGYPSVSNGPTVPGEYEYWNAFAPGAMLRPSEVYLIVHPKANETLLARANETFTYLSTGNDAFALVYGNETDYIILDSVGDFYTDPGRAWSCCGIQDALEDHTVVRKPSVVTGNRGNWSESAGTDEEDCEWLVRPVDDWSDMGRFNGVVNLPTTSTPSTTMANTTPFPTSTSAGKTTTEKPEITMSTSENGRFPKGSTQLNGAPRRENLAPAAVPVLLSVLLLEPLLLLLAGNKP